MPAGQKRLGPVRPVLKLQKSGRWPRRHSSPVTLIDQANEHTVTAITSLHGAAPPQPFAFPLLPRDLPAEMAV